ncbi:MAG: hypothetical protein ACOYMR_17215 [Ilumatobacteraceae bacterium]
MDQRYRSIAAMAASQHSVVSLEQLRRAGVTDSMRSRWMANALLSKIGPRSYLVAGGALTWRAQLTAAEFDGNGEAFIAGRSVARLYGLDGFTGDAVEMLGGRQFRGRTTSARVYTTSAPITTRDLIRVDGFRVVTAERLIIDAPLFGFTQAEIENAIDSAIRLRLVSEQRLRTRVVGEHRAGVNGSRALLDAMVDTGGESRLERWFLTLCRRAGLPRPVTQRVYRDDGRTIARVDAEFPGGLIVEVAGHGTHSSRQQIQHDEERRTLLTLRGKRVIAFTYHDVKGRPAWVASRVADGLRQAA